MNEAPFGQQEIAILQLDYQALLNNLPGAVYRCLNNGDWTFQYASRVIEGITGYSPQAFIQGEITYGELIHPDDQSLVWDTVQEGVQAHRPFTISYRINSAGGQQRWIYEQGHAIYGVAGEVIALEGYITDITRQKELEETVCKDQQRLRRQATMLDQTSDVIIVREMDGRVRYWNKSAEKLYGWTVEEAVGKPLSQLLGYDVLHLSEIDKSLLETGEWHGEAAARCKNGRIVLVESRKTVLNDEKGAPECIFSVHADISERKQAEQKIHELAFYDQLTKLPNRQLMHDRLNDAMTRSVRSGHTGAVMFIDLDNFKTLNDTMGHDYGDILLQHVSNRMLGSVRECDTVSRQGGDEFVIILEDLNADRTIAARQAQTIAEKLLSSLDEPYLLREHIHIGSASIGITCFSGHASSREELLKNADGAMYLAKAAGRGAIRFAGSEVT